MASDPPKDPQPEAGEAAPVEAVEVAPVATAPVERVDVAPVATAPVEPVEIAPAEPAVEPAPPVLPAEPVSPAKEWAAAVALTIVLGLIAFEFLSYLRNVGN